jgi:hypothetical protein
MRLKIACLRAGKSQRRAARDSNVVENRFSEIIHAWVDPREDERAAIRCALGVSEEEDPDLFEVERHDDDDTVIPSTAGVSEARSRR